MCGIAGIVSSNPKKGDLHKMLQRMAHRGPDNTGIYIDKGFAGLGHNRLAIIDPSPEANEPFQDSSDRFSLSFNGEIYNYKELKEELKPYYSFRTCSDTEVLLVAYIQWGKACLRKFNGMFSFAIWDAQEKILFAARDRFGVKPFYYSEENNGLYFSSEIKALQVLLPRNKPNEKVWANYFAHGSYGMPEETFFNGISQLSGGHYLEFSNGKLSIEKWYNFKSRVSKIPTNLSFDEVKEKYFQLLKNSIQLRFRADVPIGFNLSGGIDSSLLLALVNLFEDNRQIKAYTFLTGDDRYDEIYWVEKMAHTTSNPLEKVTFSAMEVEKSAAYISQLQDEPFGGIPTLAYSKIFEQAHKDGIKVLLDGQGMDEQWAGYDYYFQKQEKTIQGLKSKSPFRTNILNDDFAALAEKPLYPEPFDNELQNKQFRDLFFTKLPRALRFNDRISMAYSTELREPFLDHHLVELAFAQPEKFKRNNGIQKYMIREILKPLIPKDITYAPKRPLQTPQREWLADDLKGFVEEQLKNLKNSSSSLWFDHKEIEKEWKLYLNGDRDSSFHIWQWVNCSMLFS